MDFYSRNVWWLCPSFEETVQQEYNFNSLVKILQNKHQLNYPKVQNKNRCENCLFECCFTSNYTKIYLLLQYYIFINTKCHHDDQYNLLFYKKKKKVDWNAHS